MIILRLWFHLGDTGVRNTRLPRLGLVTLDEDFFMALDRVHDRRVVPVPHQAPDLLEREAQLSAEAVAGLVAQVDEGHRPALAAEGRHGHVMLLSYLIQYPAGRRLNGRLRGLGVGCGSYWRRGVKWVGIRALQAHEWPNVYVRFLDW